MPASPLEPTSTLVASSTQAGDAAPASRYLVVLGDDQMSTVSLPAKGEVVLGRDADCDVPLVDGRISRRHVRLVIDREVAVEDLGSTNGIKLRGARLERGVPAILSLGESLRLGPFTIVVLAGSAGRSGTPPRAAVVVDDPTLAGKTELVERIAHAGVNVLIQGETGAGKEVLAQTLHALSGRAGEVVAINCAALSGELLESELFGHERGAFTGAVRTKAGLLEVAGEGTALLDEIGELPLELQSKLLRVIESRKVHRVGGTRPIEIRARLIAATHRDLRAEVTAGRFRQDLFYRLNGITLSISPLRERRAAIGPLAAQFLAEVGGKGARLTPAALAALSAHDWPGNVRELKAVIERAVLLAGGARVDAEHLLLTDDPVATPATAAVAPDPDDERARFLALARRCRGNSSAIARELATSRSQVTRLAERYGIDLDALR